MTALRGVAVARFGRESRAQRGAPHSVQLAAVRPGACRPPNQRFQQKAPPVYAILGWQGKKGRRFS